MRKNRTTTIKNVQDLQRGAKKHLAKGKTVVLNGKTYTPAQVDAALQAVVDTTSDADTKKAAYHESVDAQNEAMATASPVIAGLQAYAHLNYGNSKSVLSDFGLAPQARRQPTVKTKAEAQNKATATRQARGTKGPRQRQKITATTNGATVSSPAKPSSNGSA